MRAPVAGDLDGFEVAHESWEVLEVLPELVDVFDRSADGRHALDLDAGLAPARQRSSVRLPRAQLLRADHVERGDPGDGCGRRADALAVHAVLTPGGREGCQVERIAANARPQPGRIVGLHGNGDAIPDFARAVGAQDGSCAGGVSQADEACERIRRGELGQAQPDAEPAEADGQLLAAVLNIVVALHILTPDGGTEGAAVLQAGARRVVR